VFEWFGWRANLTLLTLITAAVLLLAFLRLPETLAARDRVTLRMGSVAVGDGCLLSNRGFVAIAVSLGLALGAIFAFITDAPFLLIDLRGIPTRYYGLFQAVTVTAFFVGSVASEGSAWPLALAVAGASVLILVAGRAGIGASRGLQLSGNDAG